MKLPMSWLRDWVDVDATPEQVADALTRRGFYVEGIESLGVEHPGVVVARVLEVAKHPNADKLSALPRRRRAAEPSPSCAVRPTCAPAWSRRSPPSGRGCRAVS